MRNWGMADRADQLARTLVARLTNLQTALAEEGRASPDRTQRIATVEKVLAVEFGVTDGPTLAAVEAAAPEMKTLRRVTDREMAEFADFLRRRLSRELAET